MNDTSIESLAQALFAARRHHAQVPSADFTAALSDDTQAYAVQDRVAALLGEPQRADARHWKSGGASAATQTHAPLPAAGVVGSPARLDAGAFHRLGIEAEIALRVGHDAAAADIASAIDAMCVSIELVDSRWAEGTAAPGRLKLADLQSHGALVLGPWQPLREVDWSAQACRVELGGEVHEFKGSHSFGDPRGVLPQWAAHLGGRVRAGTVVTTGTWCGLLWAQPGMKVAVEFPGIGRAELQL